MNSATEPLLRSVCALGDDSLLLAQRLGAWCSYGPTLEEDIALTNTGLDFLGRARLLYQHAHDCNPKEQGEDYFAYVRDSKEFSNHLIYEMPNGDFAYTMVRQYLIDLFESWYYAELQNSNYPPLAAIAAKSLKEITYHLKRSVYWIHVLTNSTKEAKTRFNHAWSSLFPLSAQLFSDREYEVTLIQQNLLPSRQKLSTTYYREVKQFITHCGCNAPQRLRSASFTLQHHEDFESLISEMRYITNTMPNCKW
ncbi:MAG: phenylacetate-CoA oxygenase subunit PaaC [Methylacidiphilales bacterium]|nr:phenylacetate-CoA oxygenase subunit PaaC [Candidatus Methylacidiphilales bacterium]